MSKVAKAIASGIATGLAVYAAVLPGGVTQAELIGVALAVFASFGVTWTVPNAKGKGE